MKSNPFVNCTQSMSILDNLGQRVRFSTNTRTTMSSLVCVLLNRNSSGLVDEKKPHILLLHMQGLRLQRHQCRILYAVLTNMEMFALFLLLMARVTLTSTLHLNLEFDFLVQSLPKSIRNITLLAIQPMALIRATLIVSHSSIHWRDLSHSLKTPMKALCRNY